MSITLSLIKREDTNTSTNQVITKSTYNTKIAENSYKRKSQTNIQNNKDTNLVTIFYQWLNFKTQNALFRSWFECNKKYDTIVRTKTLLITLILDTNQNSHDNAWTTTQEKNLSYLLVHHTSRILAQRVVKLFPTRSSDPNVPQVSTFLPQMGIKG